MNVYLDSMPFEQFVSEWNWIFEDKNHPPPFKCNSPPQATPSLTTLKRLTTFPQLLLRILRGGIYYAVCLLFLPFGGINLYESTQ